MIDKIKFVTQHFLTQFGNVRIARAAMHSFLGAKTAGATPTTGCVTPPGGVGVKRRRDIDLLVAPSLRFGGAPAERGENHPISARGTRSWSFRRDGATIRCISLCPSTPTPPGGVTQPVVGVVPAVLAPRRAPPGPAVDPPRGQPGGATSVSCTSFDHSLFDHSLDTVQILKPPC